MLNLGLCFQCYLNLFNAGNFILKHYRRWMPVDQHNGDRRQETRNGLIQMAKAELQAHDAVGLLHPSVDEMLQLTKHASLGDTDPARAIVMAVPTNNNKPARPALVAASSDNQDYLALFNDA